MLDALEEPARSRFREISSELAKLAAECDELGRKSAMAAQLPARGGPCIFGKIPVGTDWLGGRTDVILQLVFTPDGRLADGNFEEVRSLLEPSRAAEIAATEANVKQIGEHLRAIHKASGGLQLP